MAQVDRLVCVVCGVLYVASSLMAQVDRLVCVMCMCFMLRQA